MLTGRKICDISVIIPTLEEGGHLEATLRGLAAHPGVEVIVVDGGSTDDTVEKAAASGARLILSQRGRSRQMNAGAREAKGELLLFLHADTILPPDFSGQIRQAAETPGFAAGAFRFVIAGEGVLLRLLEFFTNLRATLWSLPYGDQALFLPAATFRALGGFADIPLLEDVDLVKRVWRLGRMIVVPSPALTSARRWRRLGVVKTLIINQVILLAFFLGVSPVRLARWYGQRNER